jgi:hypothetical protein
MGESFDHGPPGWIRQSRKRCTKFIHNHMVVDYLSMSSVDFATPIRTGRALGYAVEVRMTQEISGLPVLRWVPDVQNFNGIVLHSVGDDMRQAPLQ